MPPRGNGNHSPPRWTKKPSLWFSWKPPNPQDATLGQRHTFDIFKLTISPAATIDTTAETSGHQKTRHKPTDDSGSIAQITRKF